MSLMAITLAESRQLKPFVGMNMLRNPLACLALGIIIASAQGQNPAFTNKGALSPREELATFRIVPGFVVELVACEPDVVDPVAIAFDERGSLYVAEMRGYPNAGVGTGVIRSGRIKKLRDRDGDGFYESATVYADNLRFPTSLLPWNKGLIVCEAPEIVFLSDRDGDGKSDNREVLYSGFGLANIQQLVNGLTWGLDGWVHACVGNNPSTVQSRQKPELPAVELRGRGIRFRPDRPGSLEPTSGGGQFGLACDEWGHWFTNTNSQHLREIVLQDRYLRRNPYVAIAQVTLDIPDHQPACQVFRLSPFEGWREERTRRRREGADSKRFPATELVPGGFVTSACSPCIYTADLFPPSYRGSSFICDPANNLIHRDLLQTRSAAPGNTVLVPFVAARAEPSCEFLASTDNWFRPVALALGVDGCLYVADFYREAIETPLSLPEDIKQRLNIESRGKGRIWRIRPARSAARQSPKLESSQQLLAALTDQSYPVRLLAQRLIQEQGPTGLHEPLRELARNAERPTTRAHSLRLLSLDGPADEHTILRALGSSEPGLREQAIQAAEPWLDLSKAIRVQVRSLAEDASPRVRFQAALSLGFANDPDVVQALADLATNSDNDSWIQSAALSSASKHALGMLRALRNSKGPRLKQRELAVKLAAMVASRQEDSSLAQAVRLAVEQDGVSSGLQVDIMSGLEQGLRNSRRPLAERWGRPDEVGRALEELLPRIDQAANAVVNGTNLSPQERSKALESLRYGPPAKLVGLIPKVLTPTTPVESQIQFLGILKRLGDNQIPKAILAAWSTLTPGVRAEAMDVLVSRPDRAAILVSALQAGTIRPNQLDSTQRLQVTRGAPKGQRETLDRLLGAAATSNRQAIVASYDAALRLAGDLDRGKQAFRKHCTTCHLLDGAGKEVGANLQAALGNKTRESLLIDILDPNREIDPRFVNYVVTMQSGRGFSGIIASETATSITLRGADHKDETLLRVQIEQIESTGRSLMPEGFDSLLTKQDMADLIAYLLGSGKKKPER